MITDGGRSKHMLLIKHCVSAEVPSTDHVMKVKLVGSSSVDLKDGAVQGGLLNQVQHASHSIWLQVSSVLFGDTS